MCVASYAQGPLIHVFLDSYSTNHLTRPACGQYEAVISVSRPV